MHVLGGIDMLEALMILEGSIGGLLIITELSLLVLGDTIISSLLVLGAIGEGMAVVVLATFCPRGSNIVVESFGIIEREGEWVSMEVTTIGVSGVFSDCSSCMGRLENLLWVWIVWEWCCTP